MFTKDQIRYTLDDISYLDWKLYLGDMGDGWYLQVQFEAADSETGEVEKQHCRKWYLSPHMTRTEILDTAFLAYQRGVLHEFEENFKYKGRPVRNPHISIAARMKSCLDTEHRQDNRISGIRDEQPNIPTFFNLGE